MQEEKKPKKVNGKWKQKSKEKNTGNENGHFILVSFIAYEFLFADGYWSTGAWPAGLRPWQRSREQQIWTEPCLKKRVIQL